MNMDSICRLCCTTKFVNNYLFDEENALNLKMELFLPIKLIKGDELPQKVCNRCSCKVNDIYQFCNVAIEAQDRLRGMLVVASNELTKSIDLSITKRDVQLPIPPNVVSVEKETQTEIVKELTTDAPKNNYLKDEPKFSYPVLIKTEITHDYETTHSDNQNDINSDDSDDISLISLKDLKKQQNSNINGKGTLKRGRGRGRKKRKSKEWEKLVNALPNSTEIPVVNKFDDEKMPPIKQEIEEPLEIKTSSKAVHASNLDKDYDEEEIYHCCICFNQYHSPTKILTHYRQHLNDTKSEPPAPLPPTPDRCPRCGKAIDASEWPAHWARHAARDRRPYRCGLCETACRTPRQILEHGLTHKGGEREPMNKRFVCDLCPEGFVYMRYLLAHRSRAHPEAAGRALELRCAVCARGFAHLNSLRRHLRAHSGDRNFLCNVCGKALSSREHLKFHLRIHSGYKPNVCKTCGKGFVKKCNLTLHERVHSGEKPHVCSHCGKAFSQRSTLVIHERYHSGARPYSCALCGRGFVAKGLLSMHLKTTCI